MPQIVDALLVTLGLDASKFTQGSKQATADLKKTKDAANTVAKELEARGNQAAQFFKALKVEALALFGVLTLGRGVKDFIRDITNADQASGLMAKTLGISVGTLTAYQRAAERMGGSAAGVASDMQGLTKGFQEFKSLGTSALITPFRQLGLDMGALVNLKPDQVLEKINHGLQGMERGKQERILDQLGITDPGLRVRLIDSEIAFQRALEHERRLGLPNDKDVAAAHDRREAFTDLTTAVEMFARTILTAATPALLDLMGWLDGIFKLHGEEWTKKLTTAWENLVRTLKSYDWDGLFTSLTHFATTIDWVVTAMGGWENATIAVFALWGASKVAAIVNAMASIATGMGGIATAGGLLMAVLRPLAVFMAAFEGARYAQRHHLLDGAQDWLNRQLLSPEDFRRYQEGQAETLRREAEEDAAGQPGATAPSTGPRTGPRTEAAPGQYKPVLDLIGRAEGTDRGRGYNETLGYGTFTGGDRNLVGMSMREIDALQKQMLAVPGNKSSALGRYQIVGTTLREYRKKLGIGDDEKFDAAMQDRIASAIIADHATPLGMARQWASMADPRTGRSYHGQHTAVSSDVVGAALAQSGLGGGDTRLARGRGIPMAGNDLRPDWYNERPQGGARNGAQNVANNSSNDNSTVVQLNGPITISTQARDAAGLARELPGAARTQVGSFARRANYGLT